MQGDKEAKIPAVASLHLCIFVSRFTFYVSRTTFFGRAAAKSAEFRQKLSDLQKQLRQIVQGAGGSPCALLQSQVEERMAEPLMNPRFAKVLEERLNYVKGK